MTSLSSWGGGWPHFSLWWRERWPDISLWIGGRRPDLSLWWGEDDLTSASGEGDDLTATSVTLWWGGRWPDLSLWWRRWPDCSLCHSLVRWEMTWPQPLVKEMTWLQPLSLSGEVGDDLTSASGEGEMTWPHSLVRWEMTWPQPLVRGRWPDLSLWWGGEMTWSLRWKMLREVSGEKAEKKVFYFVFFHWFRYPWLESKRDFKSYAWAPVRLDRPWEWYYWIVLEYKMCCIFKNKLAISYTARLVNLSYDFLRSIGK